MPRRLPALLAAGAAALLAMTAAAPAQTPASDPVVARVNGAEIHQSDLNLAEEEVGHEAPMNDEARKRDYLLDYVTDLMLVAQAAEAKKIPDSPDFKQRLAYIRNKMLVGTVLRQEAKAVVTEPTLHKIYEEEIATNAPGDPEIRARHILFRVADPKDEAGSKAAEDKVKAVIERLKKGEDFAKLASALTEDPSGKQDGGDLGYFSKDEMVPEFSDAAFGLEKGQISGPIKTQFGWHVLKVEDKRMREPPPFEKVRAEIEEIAMRKAQSDFVKKLHDDPNTKIERLDKPAAPAK
jgi:peptidyl-prolyl cis-trans isomerase C